MNLSKTEHLILRIWTYACLSSLFVSCGYMSPNNRVQRILKNNPQLRETETRIIKDTILVNTFVITDSITTESNFDLKSLSDTVTIVKDKLKILAFHDTIINRIFIKGEVKTDTIEKEIEVPIYYEIEVEKIIYRRARDGLSNYVIPILCLIIIGIYFYFRLRKQKKQS